MAIDKARSFLDSLATEFQDILALDPRIMLSTMIQWGDKLLPLHDNEKTEENYVKGCISTAYVLLERKTTEPSYDSSIESKKEQRDEAQRTSSPKEAPLLASYIVRGYSEALVIRGYMAILAQCVEFLTLQEIQEKLQTIMEEFVRAAHLSQTLTPTRSNTLGNLVDMIIKKSKTMERG